jgi:hypothetical protein
LLRLIAGLVVLSAIVYFFASGYSPPGVFGEVLRHNQAEDIDASPLLYSEVEHMSDLEYGVRVMRERAKSSQPLDSASP